jgi:pilus assembly protein CpaB
MKTRLLGGIAALLVAIIGTVLLVTYVQGADKRALANTETEDVYVVQKPIAAGTPASELGDAVRRQPVPKTALAADIVADISNLGAKVTAVSLVPGEQLLDSRMVDANAFLGPARVAVPVGMQEFTLRLPIERVAGGKITAGDTAGIFISLDETTTDPASGTVTTKSSGTQLTFHKVLVTAAQFSNGTAAKPESATQTAASDGALSKASETNNDGTYLITIARNSVDAEKIIYAVEFGKVYLSKEPSDAAENNAGVVDKTKVFK